MSGTSGELPAVGTQVNDTTKGRIGVYLGATFPGGGGAMVLPKGGGRERSAAAKGLHSDSSLTPFADAPNHQGVTR